MNFCDLQSLASSTLYTLYMYISILYIDYVCLFALSFVRIYRESDFGQSSLPMSFSGKLLQELISTTPNVTMVGTRPSSIYVTLGDKDLGKSIAVQQSRKFHH